MCKINMADRLGHFYVPLWLFLFCLAYTHANLPTKCRVTVENTPYQITNWDWKIINSSNVYYINLCTSVANPRCDVSSSVCTVNGRKVENLGSLNHKVFNATNGGAGFSIGYNGGTCEGKGPETKTWKTRIFMKCGKFLGAPQLVDVIVSEKTCIAVFEFVTKEVCKGANAEPEIPCSLYGRDNRLRDLTPLISLNGGYEVASSISGFDFHINVCRGITAKPNGHTRGCPKHSAMCRIDKNLQLAKDIGNINLASNLTLSSTSDDIILLYNSTERLGYCKEPAVTKITFKCPKDSVDKGPVLTVATNCLFEVLWETDYACPQAAIMSNSSCVLQNKYVNFDLRKLTAERLSYYQVPYEEKEGGTVTRYMVYINVCKSLVYSCGTRGTNTMACQEKVDGKVRKSLGDIRKQTLQYADRQLTLIYQHGDKCSSGLNRTTIIMFKCSPNEDPGKPVFSFENYCFYYFVWKTKYACPPSRRTGTDCRVESPAGIRYDLSELVRVRKELNWIALDGESSSSEKKIFINVCGQLTLQEETKECDRAAAICMIETKTKEVISLGSYNLPPSLNQDNSIKLLYNEGSECKKDNTGKIIKRQSTITFVCQPGDLESPPVLVARSADDCNYEFLWKSAAACSLGVNTGKNCTVQDLDAGYVFDLNPLASQIYSVNQSDYTYELKICGGSQSTHCQTLNVPVGACQFDAKASHVIGQPNNLLYYYDGTLNLTYSNGDSCSTGVKRKTHITFLCDETADDDGIGKPEYEKENYCVYHFRWFTKYACPAKITECVARAGVDQYDLTSLVRTEDNWEATSFQYGAKFYINVCRSLNLQPLVSGCPGSSAICLKTKDGSAVNLGSVTEPPRVKGQGITLTYSNGDQCTGQKDRHYQTIINFICKTGLTSSSPKFDGTQDGGCTYQFTWETAAACRITNVVGSHCQVKDPKSDTTFNLRPLMKQTGKAMYSGNLTDSEEQGTYELNICGKVGKCGDGDVGACLTNVNGTKIVLGEFTEKTEYKGEILTLVYGKGDNFRTGEQREVHIKFYCNPKVPFGSPKFIAQEGNKYFFDFQTSLVCAASAVQCSVTGNDNRVYDLTPLGLTSGNWEAVDTRTKDRHLHYLINICRPVNPTKEDIPCPGGAIGACQIDHSRNKGYNLGYVQSNPQVADKGDLTLHYSGGTECHGQFNRSTRIVFSCSEKMGSPIFLSESPFCEYLFSWQTPSACPLTRETGSGCTVVDRQYGYMFDLNKLYNKSGDYHVRVGADVTIVLNVCNKLVNKSACEGSDRGLGACITADGKKEESEAVALNNSLAYFNGQINMTYDTASSTSINFIFECDQRTSALETGPTCKRTTGEHYECYWQTAYACRALVSVGCSIRDEDQKTGVINQYDFLPLSMPSRNWEALVRSEESDDDDDVSYFINVCRTVFLHGAASVCPPTAGVCMVKKRKGYNLGRIKRGPQKIGSGIYLVYDDGDACDGGGNYSSRIKMQCGSIEGEPVYVDDSQCQYEFLWITRTACADNTNPEPVSDDCKATNPQTNVQFNLTPLRKKDDDYIIGDEEKGPTHHLNICGPLKNPPNSCPKTSGVCYVGTETYNAGMANSRLHFVDGVLFLNLRDGDDCPGLKKKRETIISFVCNSSCVGQRCNGAPVFISETNCVSYITWHTSLVCESQYECAAFQTAGQGNNTKVKYSLGRLSRSDANWVVTNEEGDNGKVTSFYLNLCRPLVPMHGINCPAGSWACWVEGDQDPQDFGRAYDPPEVITEGEVRLVYKTKVACDPHKPDKQKEIHLTFICSYGSLGHPVLEHVEQCVYHVRWYTSAACPVEQKRVGNCKIYDNGTGEVYDLNPLSKATDDVKSYLVSHQGDSRQFKISVCHALNDPGNCSEAGVCMLTKKDNGEEEKKALGYFKFRDMSYYKDEGMLILKYCSDDCSSRKDLTTSKIIFVCDKNQSTEGRPQLLSATKSKAEFTWRTSLVCPPFEVCFYDDGSSSYNLGLLSSRTRSWNYVHNGDRFWINICRGIKDGPKGCPSTASVCMMRRNSKKANVLGVTSSQRMSLIDGRLQLTYSGLPPVEGCIGGNPKVVFYFECGNHVGQPQFEREEWSSCSFIIKWKSSVACKDKLRQPLQSRNCVVKHPITGKSIDFHKLSSRTIYGMGEKQQKVSYKINICDDSQGKTHVSVDGKDLTVTSKSFYYEGAGSVFSLEMTTDGKSCKDKESPQLVVITFHCSLGEGGGSPKFDYVSSDCHLVFSWPTSIVCTEDLSRIVTDIPAVQAHQSAAAGKNVGIAFGVLLAVALIAVVAFLVYEPSKRHSLISCLRWNFKRHVLRKEIHFPTYRYQKLDVDDDDEADLLMKEAEGSDDEEEIDDDDDILPF